MVEEETRLEEVESHRAMQVDYDAALKLMLMRQADELTGFDTRADMQVQKSLQDRAIERRVYENLGKKITTREEIVVHPEKLWNLEKAKRSHAIVGNIGKPQLPSAKLKGESAPEPLCTRKRAGQDTNVVRPKGDSTITIRLIGAWTENSGSS
jgi:hypothetical protein